METVGYFLGENDITDAVMKATGEDNIANIEDDAVSYIRSINQDVDSASLSDYFAEYLKEN